MITNTVTWAPGITLEEVEKQVILSALRFYRNNKTQTANVLGISVRTVDHKLEKYEADRINFEERARQSKLNDQETLARMRGVEFTRHNTVGSPTQIQPPPTHSAATGVGVEPTQDIAPKQPVPVPKREEVQSVLPKQASGGSHHRRR